MKQDSALLLSVPDRQGHFTVVPAGGPTMKHVHMEFVRLEDGQSAELGNPDRELGIVFLEGGCTLGSDELTEEIDGRKDAFSGLPHAVYVPAGSRVEVRATGHLEAIVYGAQASPTGSVRVIHPHEIKVLKIGNGNWYINGYFVIGSDFPAQRLIVGETQIPAGNWCSVPPHSHEKDVPNVETALEEIYYFQFKPSVGFGMQGLYTDDRSIDTACIIRNHSVFLVPRGYHPNVAGPGYEMRMFWGMAGTTRDWIPHEDPDHAWLGREGQAPSDISW